MDRIPEEVTMHIQEYFQKQLSGYEVVKVRKKSWHKDDAHLYMVAAKKNTGSYAVWTSWNESTKSLNYGHYDLPDMEACERIMDEFYNGRG